MSETFKKSLKRIFYFNIIYSCNSHCVFCYSHNTVFGTKNHIAISAKDFISYLNEQKISQEDRVIVNGGEPLLHLELSEILNYLLDVGCEVLIYSNGRLLSQKAIPNLNKNFRFIIPIHGDEKIHDSITRIKGSFWETVKGLEYLVSKQNCLLDLKFIINNEFVKKIMSGDSFSFLKIFPFNNAVQITKVADTIVSKKNCYPSVENEIVSEVCAALFEEFFVKDLPIKIYDTCVKEIHWLKGHKIKKYLQDIEVYFKDKNSWRQIEISQGIKSCMFSCEMRDYCISAVNQYKVLEIMDHCVYEELE